MNILDGIQLIERGWLSSNNILISDGDTATLIDSGYVSHAPQTVELVRHGLNGRRLTRVINTHLHSDHCGGNAALQREFDCELWIPPGHWNAVVAWDESSLSYEATGQACERFTPQRALVPHEVIPLGGRCWSVLPAPGHDPHSVVLFDSTNGVLISADALWEDGFGVIFPELDGEHAFAEAAAVLDLIESLPVSMVLPGHGPAFRAVDEALSRARRRLARFVSDPRGHAWYAAKVLVKFHLLDRQITERDSLLDWVSSNACLTRIRDRHFASETMVEMSFRIIDSLCASGAARLSGACVLNGD